METPRVTKVTPMMSFVIEIVFSDGTKREVDLAEELNEGIFAALQDTALFAKVSVDGVGIGWPNGASLSPEFLYHDAKSPSQV